MTTPAQTKELNALHASLAAELAAAIRETEIKVIELPEGTRLPDGTDAPEGGKKILVKTRNAAVLSVARQFLRDNNIESNDLRKTPEGKALVEGLPYAGSPEDEDAESKTYQ